MNRRIAAFVVVSVLLASIGAYGGLIPASDEISGDISLIGSGYASVEEGRLVEYGLDTAENATHVPNRGGLGYDGRVDGNLTGVSGKDGSAVRFNGSQSRIVVENSTSIAPTDGVTFAFWVKPEGNQSANVLKAEGFCSFFVSWNTVNFVVVRDGNRIAELQSVVPVGEWTHVVGTYDSDAGARLFVNGAVADSNTTVSGPIGPPTENVTLNAASWKDGFTGSIDEFGLWTRALSETDVQMVHQDRDRERSLSGLLRVGIGALALLAVVGMIVREHVL